MTDASAGNGTRVGGGLPESDSSPRSASHWPWPPEWRSRQSRRRRCGLRRSRRPLRHPRALQRVRAQRMRPRLRRRGLLHEAGDVAVRVTPEGVIVVDDKYARTSPTCWRRSGASRHSRSNTCSTRTITPITPAGTPDSQDDRDHRAPQHPREHPQEQAAGRAARRVPRPGVDLGGVEVRADYFGRGHTNGDAVIYFPDLRVIIRAI